VPHGVSCIIVDSTGAGRFWGILIVCLMSFGGRFFSRRGVIKIISSRGGRDYADYDANNATLARQESILPDLELMANFSRY
jgi:hypothetical protein